jgi:protein phosphatase 1G
LLSHQVDDYQGPSAGCTAVCAVVRAGELYVANAGDSRCVLGRAGTAVAMTDDHKPDNAAEFQRIQKVFLACTVCNAAFWFNHDRAFHCCFDLQAGGFVADGRVNGSLNLSRALGDLEYKSNAELGPEEQVAFCRNC